MWGDETRRTGDFLRLGDLTLRGTFGGDFNLDILTLGWLSFNHFRHNLFKSTTFPPTTLCLQIRSIFLYVGPSFLHFFCKWVFGRRI